MSTSHGDELMTSWKTCIETLTKDPSSRQAVIVIFESFDQFKSNEQNGSRDVPCTLSLQFFIRNNELILHAHMRSNDAVWGLTYDLFSFTLLQECMLLELRKRGMNDLELGEYIHTAGSLHIYERHFEMASDIVKKYVGYEFDTAAPMEPIDLEGLALLVDDEEKLRTGKVDQIEEDKYSGGTRWLAAQLNAHRRKRDDERK
jgi:thymidylate synthase